MSKNFIFSMHDLKKVVPPGKTIVEGVSLSFFHGAKIGVLGLNGAGKSTVLRIMAGVDTEFSGEARPAPGTRIGYLAQEPLVDEAKTVREIVEEGVSETRALLDRFEEISMKFGEVSDDDEMQKLLDEQGALQEKIDACIERDASVAAEMVTFDELEQRCWSVPSYLPRDKPLRTVTIAGLDTVPCGGTHVAQLAELGTVSVVKLKKRKGNTKISYRVAEA